jgi:hypothetical protein
MVDFRAATNVNGVRWTSENLVEGDHVVVFTISSTNRTDNVVLFDRAEVTLH